MLITIKSNELLVVIVVNGEIRLRNWHINFPKDGSVFVRGDEEVYEFSFRKKTDGLDDVDFESIKTGKNLFGKQYKYVEAGYYLTTQVKPVVIHSSAWTIVDYRN